MGKAPTNLSVSPALTPISDPSDQSNMSLISEFGVPLGMGGRGRKPTLVTAHANFTKGGTQGKSHDMIGSNALVMDRMPPVTIAPDSALVLETPTESEAHSVSTITAEFLISGESCAKDTVSVDAPPDAKQPSRNAPTEHLLINEQEWLNGKNEG